MLFTNQQASVVDIVPDLALSPQGILKQRSSEFENYIFSRRRSSVFTVNFEHISHLFLLFILLTLNK